MTDIDVHLGPDDEFSIYGPLLAVLAARRRGRTVSAEDEESAHISALLLCIGQLAHLSGVPADAVAEMFRRRPYRLEIGWDATAGLTVTAQFLDDPPVIRA